MIFFILKKERDFVYIGVKKLWIPILRSNQIIRSADRTPQRNGAEVRICLIRGAPLRTKDPVHP